MAELTMAEVRTLLTDDGALAADAFRVLVSVMAEVNSASSDAQDLVLRLLDKRHVLNEYSAMLNGLVRQVGLFPYLETDDLSDADLVALEYHRPFGLADDVVLHEVQARVYRELLDGHSVILSAPTSFGKSLLIDAVVASGLHNNIVVVVPTIALIDETRRRLAKFSDKFRIITHASQEFGDKNILIFTQERVVDHPGLPPIDFFVVDEFYKLSPAMDAERSAILNHAFYKLFKTGAQFYLLGPDIRGLPPALPDRLDCLFLRTDYATVVAETQRIRPERDGDSSALVDLCKSLSEPTLIYCRSPQRVRDVCRWLLDGDVAGQPSGVAEACEWMGGAYHPEWLVPKALSRGIALHHGAMPRALSQFMVRAFNQGRIQFLVCTSTLIEGVNTRAKNVVIFDNQLARTRFDYFTFNNIRGRSGRMFQHFVGRVFLFHDPPNPDLPIVDVPAMTQPESTPTSLLVQLNDEDLTARSRERLRPVAEQTDLELGVIRENSGIEPEAQVTLARDIRRRPGEFAQLRWTGLPTYEQLEFACALMWDRLMGPNPNRGGIRSHRQLAFKVNQLRSTPDLVELVRQEIASGNGSRPDEAVETVLGFVRHWATFAFPRLLAALDRIQKSAFASAGLPPGDYSVFAAMVENLFMPAPLAALDEYGIPLQTARRLTEALEPDGNLDALLGRLKTLDLGSLQLHPFELELVQDACEFL